MSASSEPAGRKVIHPTYLPFTEPELLGHFAAVAGRTGTEEAERHLTYYRASVARLRAFEEGAKPTGTDARATIRRARQIEKDERFWVASALMGVFHASDRDTRLVRLLETALGPTPPVPGLATWEDVLAGDLHLFFEVNLPSPPSYRRWLREHIADRALVPYVREEAASAGERLEGPTHVDALLLCEQTGFAVLFEAKVLSDCDSKVSFDVMRNQLARNIDVMLDANPGLQPPLPKRRPERTCFVLLTPEIFQRHPYSRLYGWLLPSYQNDPAALARDLSHRDPDHPDAGAATDWAAVGKRLGWLTFEDCERIAPGACRWLAPEVTLDVFAGIFDGVVYPKGYLHDVRGGGAQSSLTHRHQS